METNLKRDLVAPTGRRDFLKWSGGAMLAGGVLLQSCKKDDDDDTPADNSKLTLTNDDFGILNYAYALEQLEADFYSKVTANASFATIFSMGEQELLKDIAAHEKAHRDFFAKAIPDANRIQALTTKYTGVNFGDRASVLATAQTFEDLGVSAYNGAGVYITSADYLVLAGKIVSVEARHAAFIRTLLGKNPVDADVAFVNYNSMPATFKSPIANANADNTPLTDAELGFSSTGNNAVEKSRKPSEVLVMAGAFINETLVSKLP